MRDEAILKWTREAYKELAGKAAFNWKEAKCTRGVALVVFRATSKK